MATATAKEKVRKLLENLPDDASIEDIQYHIYVSQKIEAGLEDADRGHTFSTEEVGVRMARGLTP